MLIVLDVRLYKETGVGRYIRSLIKYLSLLDKENKYTLLVMPQDINDVGEKFLKFNIIPAPARWHSLKEQLIIPQILNKIKPDLVHFPYFNVPLLYKGKFVVTIHDLTILNMATGKASTHSPLIYNLKRQGFLLSLKHAIFDSHRIITVSQTVKEEIIKHFKIPENKITVSYESGELEEEGNTTTPNSLPENYLLYVGNAHPHKNVEGLIAAFKILNQQFTDLKLILVGSDDFFYKRLKGYINNLNMDNKIILTGPVSNALLRVYYQKAIAFIFPSLSEGFGIPGLEAMIQGCPVVCSDIPVFKEIYGDACWTFHPQDPNNIAEKISQIIMDENIRQKLTQKGLQQSQKYSWQKMAEETLKIYNNLS